MGIETQRSHTKNADILATTITVIKKLSSSAGRVAQLVGELSPTPEKLSSICDLKIVLYL